MCWCARECERVRGCLCVGVCGRAAKSAGARAREQKWYLLPGTNQNVAGTIEKERGKNKKMKD